MSTPNTNPETMSLSELRRLSDEETAKATGASIPEDDSKRDSKGRFVADEEDVIEDVVKPEPEAITYRRQIDLGDGSGAQVFEADSMEELVDKLAQAQYNATKKIREQGERIRTIEQERKAREEQDANDNDFVLSQELLTKPTSTFKKLFKETTGYEISDFKSKVEMVDAYQQAQVENANAQTFMTTHTDYVSTPSNGAKMVQWLKLNQFEPSVENLDKAYKDLRANGLLELKDPKNATVDTSRNNAGTARIEQPTEVQPVQRRRSSTLPARRTSVPVTAGEPSEQELYSMPLAKLRELANHKARDPQR